MKSCIKLGVVWLFLLSCTDNNQKDVFEKLPSQRLSARSQQLVEKLKSSPNGWRLVYQPSKGETGTFIFHFKFVDDHNVDIASDFSSSDLQFKRSEYQIIQGSTIKLSFSTFSALHKLSDGLFSPIPGQNGQGLKGDFEFLYYGDNDKEIEFRSNRDFQKKIVFVPAPSEKFDDIADAYGRFDKFYSKFDSIRSVLNAKIIPFVQLSLKAEVGGNATPDILVNIDRATRRLSLINKNTKVVISATGYGFSQTAGRGTIMLDSLAIGEERFVQVTLDLESSFQAISTTPQSGKSLAIRFEVIEASKTDYRVILDQSKTLFSTLRTRDTNFPYFYPLFSSKFNALRLRLANAGITDVKLSLNTFPGLIVLEFVGAGVTGKTYNSLVGAAEPAIKDRLIFDYDPNVDLALFGIGERLSPAKAGVVNEMLNFLTGKKGIFIENLGDQSKERLAPNGTKYYPDAAYRFTSADDLEMSCTFLQVAK